MPKHHGRMSLSVAIVALLASIRHLIIELGEDTMANFEKVDAALAELSEQVTKIGDQLAALPAVEDPAVQAKLDEIAQSVSDAAARIDALIEDETAPDSGGPGEEPHPDQTLPGDLPSR